MWLVGAISLCFAATLPAEPPKVDPIPPKTVDRAVDSAAAQIQIKMTILELDHAKLKALTKSEFGVQEFFKANGLIPTPNPISAAIGETVGELLSALSDKAVVPKPVPLRASVVRREPLPMTLLGQEIRSACKTLGETEVVVISGSEASMVSGGEVPVFVPRAGDPEVKQFMEFRLKLKVLARLLDHDQVSLVLDFTHGELDLNRVPGESSGQFIDQRGFQLSSKMKLGEYLLVAGQSGPETTRLVEVQAFLPAAQDVAKSTDVKSQPIPQPLPNPVPRPTQSAIKLSAESNQVVIDNGVSQIRGNSISIAQPAEQQIQIEAEIYEVDPAKLAKKPRAKASLAKLLKKNGFDVPKTSDKRIAAMSVVRDEPFSFDLENNQGGFAFNPVTRPTVRTWVGHSTTIGLSGAARPPVVEVQGPNGAIVLRELGNKLHLLPVVEADGTIVLDVRVEESKRDDNSRSVEVSGIEVPAITSRAVSLATKLKSGQYLLIANGTTEADITQFVQLRVRVLAPEEIAQLAPVPSPQVQPVMTPSGAKSELKPSTPREGKQIAAARRLPEATVTKNDDGTFTVEDRWPIAELEVGQKVLIAPTAIGRNDLRVRSQIFVELLEGNHNVSPFEVVRWEPIPTGRRVTIGIRGLDENGKPNPALEADIEEDVVKLFGGVTTCFVLSMDDVEFLNHAWLDKLFFALPVELRPRQRELLVGESFDVSAPKHALPAVHSQGPLELSQYGEDKETAFCRITAVRPGLVRVIHAANHSREFEKFSLCRTEYLVKADTRELEHHIREQFPTAQVTITSVGTNSLLLRGTVGSDQDSRGIAELAEEFAPRIINRLKVGTANQNAAVKTTRTVQLANGTEFTEDVPAGEGYSVLQPLTPAPPLQLPAPLGERQGVSPPTEPSREPRRGANATPLAETRRVRPAAATSSKKTDQLRELLEEIRELRRDVRSLNERLERDRVEKSERNAVPIARDLQNGVLYFEAAWCAPCRKMEHTVGMLEVEGAVIRHLDADRDKAWIERYRVTSLPTFIRLFDGREVERLEGLVEEARLRQFLQPKAPEVNDQAWRTLGLRFSTVSDAELQKLQLKYRGGMRITEVRPNSPATRTDLRPDDILVGLHTWETTNFVMVAFAIEKALLRAIDPLEFYAVRDSETLSGGLQFSHEPHSAKSQRDAAGLSPPNSPLPPGVSLETHASDRQRLSGPAYFGEADLITFDAAKDVYVLQSKDRDSRLWRKRTDRDEYESTSAKSITFSPSRNLLKLSEPNSSSRAENVEADFALLVTQYNKLFDERRHAEAEVIAKQAKELDPQNPVAEVMLLKAKFVRRIASQEQAREEQSRREVLDRVLDRPLRPRDVQIEVGVTPADREAAGKLDAQVELDSADLPLRKVIEQLATSADVNIVFDKLGLEEAGVTPDERVSRTLKGVKLRSALKIVLDPLKLGYVFDGEVLKITSRSRTDGPAVVVVYPVSDLLGTADVGEELGQIRDLIYVTVGGEKQWLGNDRPPIKPYIQWNVATKSLVVRHTRAMHEEVETFLTLLRQTRRLDSSAKNATLPPLTAEEQRIIEKLSSKASMHFENAPLKQVLTDLGKQNDFNIVLDAYGLKEVGLKTNTPVTLGLDQVRLSTALRLLLEPLQLDYVVKHEVLHITSRSRATGELIVATYPVADFICRKQSPEFDLTDLCDTLMSMIDVDSWETKGGPATVRRYMPNPSLVVRQTRANHTRIRELLESLRKLQAEKPKAEAQGNREAGTWTDIAKRHLEPKPEKSKSELVVKTYSVADLVTPIGVGDTDVRKAWQPLQEMIAATVAPSSWEQSGGSGRMSFNDSTGSLVVRQTAEVQEQLTDLLKQLRALTDQQIAIEFKLLKTDTDLSELEVSGVPEWSNLKRGEYVALNPQQFKSLLEAVPSDRRTNTMTLPKVTALNGQLLIMSDETLRLTGVVIQVPNRDLIRLQLNVAHREDSTVSPGVTGLVKDGHTMLIDITDAITPGKQVGVPIPGTDRLFKNVSSKKPLKPGERLILMATPRGITLEEEESLLGIPD
jgi:Flp pilus assembly secretin CpaC/thiol-disulfide isomerase/thioredoxin